MITPEEFPYITSIFVNDCYAYQNFNIDLVKHQPFSHLILTGKNGSGKSTILRDINSNIKQQIEGFPLTELNRYIEFRIENGTAESINEIKKGFKDEGLEI